MGTRQREGHGLNSHGEQRLKSRGALRWVEPTSEALCCVGARSVLEVTREVTFLAGADKGKTTKKIVLYVSSLKMEPDRQAFAKFTPRPS